MASSGSRLTFSRFYRGFSADRGSSSQSSVASAARCPLVNASMSAFSSTTFPRPTFSVMVKKLYNRGAADLFDNAFQGFFGRGVRAGLERGTEQARSPRTSTSSVNSSTSGI